MINPIELIKRFYQANSDIIHFTAGGFVAGLVTGLLFTVVW